MIIGVLSIVSSKNTRLMNPYEELSKYHPSKDGTDRYWILNSLDGDTLLHKVVENFGKAKKVNDRDYQTFMLKVLEKEGFVGEKSFEEEWTEEEVREIFLSRRKIKVKIASKGFSASSSSKLQARVPDDDKRRILVLMGCNDLQFSGYMDPVYIRRKVIRYIQSQKLQNRQRKELFRVDEKLSKLLNLAIKEECSYYELKYKLQENFKMEFRSTATGSEEKRPEYLKDQEKKQVDTADPANTLRAKRDPISKIKVEARSKVF